MNERTNQPPEAALLPEELWWADGGHASDVVLTALADGQLEIVPRAVRAHVEGCAACTTHLGNAALLSLHAARELEVVARDERRAAPERAPLPRLAIGLGLAVAALGLAPSLLDLREGASGLRSFAVHDAPLLLRALEILGRRVLDPGNPVGLALTYGAATLLVLVGIAAVRLLPKKETSS